MLDQPGHAQRNMDQRMAIRRPGLDQANADVGILAQPCGEHTARRAAAHDDVIEHRCRLALHPQRTCSPPVSPASLTAPFRSAEWHSKIGLATTVPAGPLAGNARSKTSSEETWHPQRPSSNSSSGSRCCSASGRNSARCRRAAFAVSSRPPAARSKARGSMAAWCRTAAATGRFIATTTPSGSMRATCWKPMTAPRST